jgi:hypothetical protein
VIANTRLPFALAIWLINLRENKDARIVTEIMSNEKWQETVKIRVQSLIHEAEAQGIDLGKRESQVMHIPNELQA